MKRLVRGRNWTVRRQEGEWIVRCQGLVARAQFPTDEEVSEWVGLKVSRVEEAYHVGQEATVLVYQDGR